MLLKYGAELLCCRTVGQKSNLLESPAEYGMVVKYGRVDLSFIERCSLFRGSFIRYSELYHF